jgi:osmotically-inducible protein OsmY
MALHQTRQTQQIRVYRIGRVMAVALAAGILTMGAACQLHHPKSDQYFDDGEITIAIESRLAHEKVVDLSLVEVETKNGVVHLRGTVETLDQRTQAGKVASQVTGVTGVDNELEIYRR